MEFIAKIPDNLPEIIENNGDEVKAWLAEKMESYSGIVVTPDTIRAAKDDKAALNKLRAALEERRKEVKRDYLAPYQRFEEIYKELIALIDAPISSIDKQIKAFEEQELSEKYARIESYFNDCMASSINVPIEVDFDRILNPKWKNKTMKESALQQEIYDTLCRIRDDVQELHDYYAESPHFTAIMNCYMQGYDKGCALAYAAALVQQEQRRQEQEAQRSAQQPVREPEQPVYELSEEEQEQLITGTFRVTGTRAQIIALRDFMRNQKITFELVKEK